MVSDPMRSRLELLINVSREVACELDLRMVLQRLLLSAIHSNGGERGSMVVLDDQGKPVQFTTGYEKQFHEHTLRQLRKTLERALAGWVVPHQQPVLVPDPSRDGRGLGWADDALDKSSTQSAICVPLPSHQKMVGVLTPVHSMSHAFPFGN